MKIKALPIVVVIMLVISALASCLGGVESYDYDPETSITSFSIGTLYIDVVGLDSLGNDSAYYDSVDGSEYPFTINQLTRVIENKDSLPLNTRLDKVPTSVSYDAGYLFYTKLHYDGDEGTDTLWTDDDSISFEYGPLEFKVWSYAGVWGDPYTVKVNVHQENPDSMGWSNHYSHTFVSEKLTRQKAVFADEKIFVFGKDASGDIALEYTSLSYDYNGDIASKAYMSSWKKASLPDGTEPYSAVVWLDQIWFVANNTLYVMDPQTVDYEEASLNGTPSNLSLLLAGAVTSSNEYLYGRAADGQFYVYDTSSATWKEDGEADEDYDIDIDYRITSTTMPVSYNSNFTHVLTISENPVESDSCAIIGNRLTSDKYWMALTAREDTMSCPNIVDPTIYYYNDKLYAFGGSSLTNTSSQNDSAWVAFGAMFISENSGLSWQISTINTTFPEDNESFVSHYDESVIGGYSSVLDEQNYIWIIWTDGTASRGRINYLGYSSKW